MFNNNKILMKKLAYFIFLIMQLWVAAWAQEAFVVKRIVVEGEQRISPATIESYLPVRRGQVLRPSQTGEILKSLYQTGFFDHITLSRSNDTLIIHVVERPTIGQLKITGNSVIPTDKLTTVMKSLDIAEGRVYNKVVLDRITQSLLNQYYILGRYNARVDVKVTPMTRNRVLVKIEISEGLVAKVRRITIIGAHIFEESTLIRQMDLDTTGVFSFISQSDRYSEEKLDISLDKIRSYYMDRGYLRFEIKSAQAQVTPDRKGVYLTIVLDEGELYTVKSAVVAGKLVMPRAELEKAVYIKPGETFSRKKVIDAEKALTALLGDEGYIFSTISVHPDIQEATHQVVIVFEIKPGKRAYVRHITFSDNTRTNDVALRREIEQMEAAPASSSLLEESKHRLQLLPYVKEVDMSVKPVPNVDDKIDVNYKVKEEGSNQATFRVGYSGEQQVIFGAGINQKNFLGTGSTLGLNLQRSRYEQIYAVDYTDPYYTLDGISRSISFSISKVDPGTLNKVTNDYTTNEYDLGLIYGIPVGQQKGIFSRIIAGVVYQNTLVYLNSNPMNVSNQVMSFINQHGKRFQELDFRLGFSRDSRDKAIFATRGILQSVFVDAFAPLTHQSVSFYTANYNGTWYQPITDQFIIKTKGTFGYGNGFHGVSDYPFFRNYYAGGIESVRGYQVATLGPRDSKGKSYGGNILTTASVGLIFPNFLSDSLRTSLFVDAGNVYAIGNNRGFGCQLNKNNQQTCSANSGPIRLATGIEADIMTPFGPIALSLAKPLNHRKGDDEDIFQFSLGANF
jgi:outer membrane protein insertion porin family